MRSAPLLSLAALAAACCAHRPATEESMQDDPATAVVKDRAASAASLLSAVGRVPTSAPASLWSGVANDAGFPPAHRSVAAWQLIKRHLPSGIALGGAAAVLAGASWLDIAELSKIEVMGGELPVAIPEHGAAFVIHLPRDGAEVPDLGAYLALDRDADAAALRAALQGKPTAALDVGHLTGVAVFPESLGPAGP